MLEVQVHYRDHIAGRTMGSTLPLLVREGPDRGSAALGLGANKGRPDHPMLPSPAVPRVFNIFPCNQSAVYIDLLSCQLFGNPTFTPSRDKCMHYYSAIQAAQLPLGMHAPQTHVDPALAV